MADIFDPLPWLIMLPLAVYARGYFATVKESAPFWPIAAYLLAAVNALFLSADLFNIYVTLELPGWQRSGWRRSPASSAWRRDWCRWPC